MRRTCTLVLCICIIVSVLSPVSLAYNAQNTENMLVDGYVTAREFREAQSVMTYQGIVDEIDPESCGGVFLDENGTLNIWVVPSYTSRVKGNVDRAKEMTSDKFFNENVPLSVVYRTTSRSIATMERVSDELLSQSDILGVFSTRIDEINNVLIVRVNMSTYNTGRVAKICSELDGGYIIEQGSELELQTVVANGEEAKTSGSFTIACGVTYKISSGATVQYGFLTAGHCASYVGEEVYNANNVLIGTFVYGIQDYSQGTDFALIERANSSIVPSMYFTDGSSVDYLPGTAPSGSTIKLYCKNNKVYSGDILSLNSNTPSFKNFIETNISSTAGGDSGSALVYKLYIGGGQYTNYVIGTHTGRSSESGQIRSIGYNLR